MTKKIKIYKTGDFDLNLKGPYENNHNLLRDLLKSIQPYLMSFFPNMHYSSILRGTSF